jgi:hypothetical protein
MSAPAWHSDVSAARILCIGADVGELIQVQCLLDGEPDFVTITNDAEMEAALTCEPAFDIIIMGQGIDRQLADDRLRRHSPDAERLVIIHNEVDASTVAMIEGDCRVMRLLRTPLSAELLCDAVADALLRHRARALRASAVPRVTPMGGNPCCTSRPA